MHAIPRAAFRCMVMILLGPLTASAAVTEIPFELGKDHRIYVEGAINGSRRFASSSIPAHRRWRLPGTFNRMQSWSLTTRARIPAPTE